MPHIAHTALILALAAFVYITCTHTQTHMPSWCSYSSQPRLLIQGLRRLLPEDHPGMANIQQQARELLLSAISPAEARVVRTNNTLELSAQ
jgi:hypothetical protein